MIIYVQNDVILGIIEQTKRLTRYTVDGDMCGQILRIYILRVLEVWILT